MPTCRPGSPHHALSPTLAATPRSAVAATVALLAAVAAMLAPAPAAAQSAGVAFTSFRDGVAHVYAVNADGSGMRPLTRTPDAAYEASPSYSPDGRRIVYTCGNFELCVMNADGTAPSRLTANDWPGQLRYDTSPAWSPDGTTIAFVRTVAGKDEIWLVAPDGSGLRQLAVPAGVNSSPSFSADSRTIAFAHATDETGEDDDLPSSSKSAIYVVGVDGSGLRRLTGKGINASDPAWSPNGAQIAFARSYEDDPDQLFVMNADGSARRPVTSAAVNAAGPAWSPDSTRIVFSTVRSSGASLYHVAATGGRAVRLTTGRGSDFEPTWQGSAPTTLPQQAVPAAPPSIATPDARVVGVLLRSLAGILPVIGIVDADTRPAELLTAGNRLASHARRIRTAARSLHPTSRGARSVRTTLLETMPLLEGIAAGTRPLARALRRHDRRAARKAREGILFALAFGVLLPLADATGDADISQAAL